MSALRTLDFTWNRADTDPGIWVFRAPHDTEVSDHNHVFHEIVYVESGSADHVSSEGTRKLRPGDLIVLLPGVWHAYRRPRGLVIVNCLFDNRLIQSFGRLLERAEGSFDLFRRRVRRPEQRPPVVLHARPADRTALVRQLDTMINEQRDRANGWEVAVTAALLEVLLITTRLSRSQHASQPVRLADRTGQAVLDAVSYLEAHYPQPFRLAPLARMFHLSPAHLSRGFSKRMGMGMVEFVHRLRVEEACRLLHWSDEPIGEIARRVGYNEIAYFSRCFRAQTGMSPREYRRSQQGVVGDGPVREVDRG